MTGEYRRKNWDTGDSKSIFWKNTGEKLQEHIKKIDVKSINRYRWMWNFIQQHDQTRSIRHQTYPIGLSINFVSHLKWTGWRHALLLLDGTWFVCERNPIISPQNNFLRSYCTIAVWGPVLQIDQWWIILLTFKP